MDLLDNISAAFAHQIFIDGIFNADPHPGNLLVDRETRCPVLLDFGLTKQIPRQMRLAFARMLVAAADSDVTALLDALRQMGLEEASLANPSEAMDSVKYMFRDAKPTSEQRQEGMEKNILANQNRPVARRPQGRKGTGQIDPRRIPDPEPEPEPQTKKGRTSMRNRGSSKKGKGRGRSPPPDRRREKSPPRRRDPSPPPPKKGKSPQKSRQGQQPAKALKAANEPYSVVTGKRYPTEGTPGSILFMLRVVSCLRGLSITLGLPHSYLQAMKPYAIHAIRLEVVKSEEQQLCFNPQSSTPMQKRISSTIDRVLKNGEALGIQVCVYHKGEVVINLSGGECGPVDPRPITPNTLFNSFSCGKALSALLVHVMVDKGWIQSLEDKVTKYWPVFGAGNSKKQQCTVRMFLEHRAGLSGSTEPSAGIVELCDFDHMVDWMARAPLTETVGKPRYHMLTYGWLLGGLIEAVAVKNQLDFSYSQLVRSLIVDKLGIEGHVFTEIPERGSSEARVHKVYDRLASVSADQKLTSRAGSKDIFSQIGAMGAGDTRKMAGFDPRVFNDPQIRQSCIPSANTHLTAFGLATIYSALSGDGSVNGNELLSKSYVKNLNTSMTKMKFEPKTYPNGFRKLPRQDSAKGKTMPYGMDGLRNCIAYTDPSANMSVAVLVNEVSAKPSATNAVIQDITASSNLSELFWYQD